MSGFGADSGPGKAIPNDDPECKCLLEPQGPLPPGFIAMTGWDGYANRTLAYDSNCPHHGSFIKCMQRDLLSGGFSVGQPLDAGEWLRDMRERLRDEQQSGPPPVF